MTTKTAPKTDHGSFAILEDLERLTTLRAEVEEMMTKAVRKARKAGFSWYDIGPAMGVSRQAACEKYGKRLNGPKR
jgi:hypothetical protein